MKVLFPFVGDTIGGSHVATCLLIKHLQNETHHEPLVALHQDGVLAQHLTENDINYFIFSDCSVVQETHFLQQFLTMIGNVKVLKSFLDKNSFDVVHTNDLRMHYTWILATFFSVNARHVWHQHSQTSSWRLAVLSFFTDRVLTISNYCKHSFPYFFRRKTKVVFNPFERSKQDSQLTSPIKQMLGLSERHKTIGFIGNMTAQKRPDFFLKIAKTFCYNQSANHPYHFVLIGEKREPIYSELQAYIRKTPLTDRVHFLGRCFPVEPYIQEIDVIIAPSINEGLGRTIIEAMFLNTPVIATRHGGHEEIIEHNKTGFLINANDVNGFANALNSLLNNKVDYDRISKKAYEQALQRFSLEHYFQEVMISYEV